MVPGVSVTNQRICGMNRIRFSISMYLHVNGLEWIVSYNTTIQCPEAHIISTRDEAKTPSPRGL